MRIKKEVILAMEAGENLDRLVSTEVMGELMPELTPENALNLQLAGSPIKSPKGNWVCLCRYEENDIPVWRPLPYSTDISTAWQVVEKMRESDKYNFKRIESLYKEPGQYDDTFIEFCANLMEILGVTIKDSVIATMAGRPAELPEYPYPATLTLMRKLSPEAICKAALLAKLGYHL